MPIPNSIRIKHCPVCKYGWLKFLTLVTDWGYENFLECPECGVILRDKSEPSKE
jgi:uncharacterized Zn finger protein